MVPRQSGSLEWRLDRGEMGAPVNSSDSNQKEAKKEETKKIINMEKRKEEVKQPLKKEQASQNLPQQLMAEARSEEGKYARAQQLKVDAQQLYKQLTKGCGNPQCQTSNQFCVQKTTSAQKDKTDVVQAILKMTITGNYKLCNSSTK